ncbi:hypothetical protein H312_03172 [Anncaliia algerae PRA339]|uniref:Uncharacterized protein n=1 Tax=Anncaliia algerae PRA339 TaxID=1288291 RepID=A0A059EX02_9MICR|nr:hypothetical protein H312_03172 [Anncaliia algerae PRA339]
MGKKVWIRNKIRTKTSERNLGPFKVLSHKKNLGIVELDLGYYKKWVGIRDITKVKL